MSDVEFNILYIIPYIGTVYKHVSLATGQSYTYDTELRYGSGTARHVFKLKLDERELHRPECTLTAAVMFLHQSTFNLLSYFRVSFFISSSRTSSF